MNVVHDSREWLLLQGFDIEVEMRGPDSCWADLVWVANRGFVVRRYSCGKTPDEATLEACRRFELALAPQIAPATRS